MLMIRVKGANSFYLCSLKLTCIFADRFNIVVSKRGEEGEWTLLKLFCHISVFWFVFLNWTEHKPQIGKSGWATSTAVVCLHTFHLIMEWALALLPMIERDSFLSLWNIFQYISPAPGTISNSLVNDNFLSLHSLKLPAAKSHSLFLEADWDIMMQKLNKSNSIDTLLKYSPRQSAVQMKDFTLKSYLEI